MDGADLEVLPVGGGSSPPARPSGDDVVLGASRPHLPSPRVLAATATLVLLLGVAAALYVRTSRDAVARLAALLAVDDALRDDARSRGAELLTLARPEDVDEVRDAFAALRAQEASHHDDVAEEVAAVRAVDPSVREARDAVVGAARARAVVARLLAATRLRRGGLASNPGLQRANDEAERRAAEAAALVARALERWEVTRARDVRHRPLDASDEAVRRLSRFLDEPTGGARLVVFAQRGAASLLDLDAGTRERLPVGLHGGVQAVSVDGSVVLSDGDRLIRVGRDGSVRRIDGRGGALLRTHDGRVLAWRFAGGDVAALREVDPAGTLRDGAPVRRLPPRYVPLAVTPAGVVAVGGELPGEGSELVLIGANGAIATPFAPTAAFVSAHGSTVAWTDCAVDVRDRCALHLTDVVAGTDRLVPSPPDVAFTSSAGEFDPSGRTLAMTVPGRSEPAIALALVDVATGGTRVVRFPRGTAFDTGPPVWSADGRWLFAVVRRGFAVAAWRVGSPSSPVTLRPGPGPRLGVVTSIAAL